MIVIANSQKYGTGVTINPNGAMDDGKFELVILKNLDLVVLGKLFQEIHLDSVDVEIFLQIKQIQQMFLVFKSMGNIAAVKPI
jgi:diacylglycerol kinase family enzyme